MSTCSAVPTTRTANAAIAQATEVPKKASARGGALSAAAHEYTNSIARNDAMAIDGAEIGHGLPADLIHLGEVNQLLLHPSAQMTARDAVWRVLITRSRTFGGAWTTAAIGVAMPALRAMFARLARRFPEAEAGDIDSELIIGFLAALSSIELRSDRVMTRLCTPTFTAARRTLRQQIAASRNSIAADVSAPQPQSFDGDEHSVLDRAVQVGTISAVEADVIAKTRLENVNVKAYAELNGRDYMAVLQCRSRGERKLKAAILDGDLSQDTDVVLEATTTTAIGRDYEGNWRRM